jgi:hypothetical protein
MESTAYSLLQHNCQFTLGKNIPIWAKQLRLTVFITGFQFPRSQPRTQEFILTPDIKKNINKIKINTYFENSSGQYQFKLKAKNSS